MPATAGFLGRVELRQILARFVRQPRRERHLGLPGVGKVAQVPGRVDGGEGPLG